MSRLACIQYLIDNGVFSSEWQEAGMWNAVQHVMGRPDARFETVPQAEMEAWLDSMIEYARSN